MNIERKAPWDKDNSDIMKRKLEMLDVESLKKLLVKIGAPIAGGIEKIEDRDGVSAKEQIIIALHECDTHLVEKELERQTERHESEAI